MDEILKVLKKQCNSDNCIVCGKTAETALGMDFYELEEGVLLGVAKGKFPHQSYPDRMHGGMITAILDETICRAVQITDPDIWGVTGKIEVSFKKPVPLGETLLCFGKITGLYKLGFTGKGYIEDERGNVLATATAKYVRTPLEATTSTESFLWKVFPDSTPPESAVIRHPELLV